MAIESSLSASLGRLHRKPHVFGSVGLNRVTASGTYGSCKLFAYCGLMGMKSIDKGHAAKLNFTLIGG